VSGRVKTAVTADRGYGYAAVEADLHDLGVGTVVIPRASNPLPAGRVMSIGRWSSLPLWNTGSAEKNGRIFCTDLRMPHPRIADSVTRALHGE
jgi:hypothetical protein